MMVLPKLTPPATAFRGGVIRCFYEDRAGVLWIGSSKGLVAIRRALHYLHHSRRVAGQGRALHL